MDVDIHNSHSQAKPIVWTNDLVNKFWDLCSTSSLNHLSFSKTLITSHSELIRDDYALFNTVLKFYGFSTELFLYKAIHEKSAEHNFRLGSHDKWRRVFTPAQQKKVTDMIPHEWRERFGWNL